MKRLTVEGLIEGINSRDPDVRTATWLQAGQVGAPAVKPLAGLMRRLEPVVARLAAQLPRSPAGRRDRARRKQLREKQQQLRQPLEVARAAKRGLWKIVRHVGRPGAAAEKNAVVAELLGLLDDTYSTAVRREVLWMLSELAGDEAVAPVARYLTDQQLREDARMVLERIPGEQSLAALKTGLEAAPNDFKIHIAQSLRARGVRVPGLPCQKLVPSKEHAASG